MHLWGEAFKIFVQSSSAKADTTHAFFSIIDVKNDVKKCWSVIHFQNI